MVQGDEGDGDVPVVWVGGANDGGGGDRRMFREHRLDLAGRDVRRAADDDVLAPAGEPVPAVVVAAGEVAGDEPAVAVCRCRRGGIVPVAAGDGVAAHQHLAL